MSEEDRDFLISHVKNGNNVVIVGGINSGKTLLTYFIANSVKDTMGNVGGGIVMDKIGGVMNSDLVIYIDSVPGNSLDKLDLFRGKEWKGNAVVTVEPRFSDLDMPEVNKDNLLELVEFNKIFKNPLVIWCKPPYEPNDSQYNYVLLNKGDL